MREIKFRAWDKQNQCWVAPEIVEKWAIFTLENTSGVVHKFMQYTGLKDKDGKEIYEEDIVNYSIQGTKQVIPSVVEWTNTGFELFFQDTDPYFRLDLESVEVIGNIYENPELLV